MRATREQIEAFREYCHKLEEDNWWIDFDRDEQFCPLGPDSEAINLICDTALKAIEE